MKEVVYHHSSGGLIIHNGKVLVIHWAQPRDSYDFPKGGIEADESSEEACVREVFEETGYQTKILALVGHTHYEYDWIDGTYIKKDVDYYLLEPLDTEVSTPHREAHETFENIWLSFDDAMELLTRDIDKDILQRALNIAVELKETS